MTLTRIDSRAMGLRWAGLLFVGIASHASAFSLNKATYDEPKETTQRLESFRRLYSEGRLREIDEAAASGSSVAMYAAAMARIESASERRRADGVSLLQRAADSGSCEAMHVLGGLYQRGVLVPPDVARAEFWLSRAAALNYPPSVNAIGLIALDRAQRGVMPYTTPIKHFEAAASAGSAPALRNLGGMFRRGLGVPADPGRASTYLRKSAELGDPYAMEELGEMCVRKEIAGCEASEAAALFRRAIASGNGLAGYDIGLMQLDGIGIQRDATEATESFRVACLSDHAKACTAHGRLLASQSADDVDRLTESLEAFSRASKLGDPSGDFELGVIYLRGKGVLKDLGRARSHFEAASEKGNAAAAFNLGAMYLRGDGVARDERAGFKLIRLAAQRGDSRATAYLAEAAKAGVRVPDIE